MTESTYLLDFAKRPPDASCEGMRTWHVHAQRFSIAWTELAHGPGTPLQVDSAEEYLLLLPQGGADVLCGAAPSRVPGRSVCVIPAGRSAVVPRETGCFIRLFAPCPAQLSGIGLRPAIPVSRPLLAIDPRFKFKDGNADPCVRIYRLDDFPNSPGMPLAKLFQSSTLSINWVEYSGPRDRASLSPHAHDSFEQGSLALEGTFVHHFRLPWTPNAAEWQDDQHIRCSAGSVAIIPPGLVHTTEGVNAERHCLIDIFSPPRRDFIARNQVLNADHYIDLATPERGE